MAAKKLHMTTADYLVIAVSPALIMALVGSLVYFLIEVFYAGEYEGRLCYAFGLFVFAAVLIARISIEEGREYAAMFALPLGGAMFLVMLKFVEHPSPFSWLINLVLMGVVWWCADKLTWDSTVIDDSEDASGEGLMQRIGVDGPEKPEGKKTETLSQAPSGMIPNELLEVEQNDDKSLWQRVKRRITGRKGPHTPGIWVLYFSLAALPLFGVGQWLIPVEDAGRRRYVFFLLLVYVASALALLVTTSFLNLRRYLRQRRIEMPLPIAGTWVGVGAVLIVIVMMLAMLIPRPGAEVALSRVPWQVRSPEGLSPSNRSVLRDGGEKQEEEQQSTTSGEKTGEKGEETGPPDGSPAEKKTDGPDAKSDSGKQQGEGEKSSRDAKSGKQDEHAKRSDTPPRSEQKGETTAEKNEPGKSNESSDSKQESSDQQKSAESAESSESSQTSTPPMSHPMSQILNATSPLNGLLGLLKILFYLAAAIFIAVCVWKYRQQIMQAISDLLRMLRELFGGRRAAEEGGEEETTATRARVRSFAEFHDPFLAGVHGQMPPEELVRYTFAAFEAWASDRGRPRSPDCTPLELMQSAVEPRTPLHVEARKLVRLYGELAYASRRVPRQAADELGTLWQLMRSTTAIN